MGSPNVVRESCWKGSLWEEDYRTSKPNWKNSMTIQITPRLNSLYCDGICILETKKTTLTAVYYLVPYWSSWGSSWLSEVLALRGESGLVKGIVGTITCCFGSGRLAGCSLAPCQSVFWVLTTGARLCHNVTVGSASLFQLVFQSNAFSGISQ